MTNKIYNIWWVDKEEYGMLSAFDVRASNLDAALRAFYADVKSDAPIITSIDQYEVDNESK